VKIFPDMTGLLWLTARLAQRKSSHGADTSDATA
jgi:hypothetical protein